MSAPALADAPWLTQGPLAKLLSVLDRDGEEARAVGGAVRNALLGEPLGEIDVATTAVPSAVISRAEAAAFKTVATGIDHGTVTVIVDGRPFEVTTLREDVETFGRHAKVRFGRDWKRDAERRDFTMNALSASRDGRVHDYVGGLADLQARQVRFIGDPAQRIREDYLRILRLFRFHAAFENGAPDPAGVLAAIAGREGLQQLSRERIRIELMKLLVAPGAAATLTIMAEAGLLMFLISAVPLVAQFSKLAAVERALGLAPDAVRRLGALVMHVVDDAERMRERLRLSNVEYERLASMAQRWWRVGDDLSDRAGRALLYRLGPDRFVDRVLFAWARADAGPDDPQWRNFLRLPERWTAPAFHLKAATFIDRGMAPGPSLGKAMADAEAAWIAGDFPADAEALRAIADKAVRSSD